MMKKFIFSLIYLILISAFTFVILELCARFLVYKKGVCLERIDEEHYKTLRKKDPPFQFDKDYWSHDEELGQIVTPDNKGIFRGYSYPKAEFRNAIKINSWGYRSSREYNNLPDKKMRIAILGDSFVEGLEIEENKSFPRIIENKLNENGFNALTYNFGKRSTGTIHQYIFFNRDVLKTKPHVVVLVFFRNDLIDSSTHYTADNPHLTPCYDYQNGHTGKRIQHKATR